LQVKILGESTKSECNNTAVKVIPHPNCYRCLLGNLLTCH